MAPFFRSTLPALLLFPLLACQGSLDFGDDDEGDDDSAVGDDDTTPEPPEENPYLGNTYLLDLGATTVVQPEGGEIFQTLLKGQYVILGVTGGEEDSIGVTGALALVEGKSVVQDPCYPVIPFPEGEFSSEDQSFAVGPVDWSFSFDFQGFPLDVILHEFGVAGAFAGEGTYIEGLDLIGVMDTRDFADILEGLGIPGDQACLFLAYYLGLTCEECSDGEEACFTLEMTSKYMDQWSGAFDPEQTEPADGCD